MFLLLCLTVAFCALIHRFRPDLIPYDTLSKDEPLKNHELGTKNINITFDEFCQERKELFLIISHFLSLSLDLSSAFSVAEKLGIPRLLEPEDMLVEPYPEVIRVFQRVFTIH
jgi:hypothetical protein